MYLRPVRVAVVLVLLLAPPGLAWNNDRSGNSNTDTSAECSNAPYATHDWIERERLILAGQLVVLGARVAAMGDVQPAAPAGDLDRLGDEREGHGVAIGLFLFLPSS